MLDAVEILDDLGISPGNRLGALRRDRAGQRSRINQRVASPGPKQELSTSSVDYH